MTKAIRIALQQRLSRDSHGIKLVTSDNQKSDAALEEAMDWLLRLNSIESDADARRKFDEWIAASERNRQAWRDAERAWRLVGETPPAYEGLWRRQSGQAERKKHFVRRHLVATTLMAVAASLFLIMIYPSIMTRIRADYTTSTAQTRTLTLADGSRVEMAGSSAIKVDVTLDHRRVTLLAGEAFFDVVHDSARPFVVQVGNAEVTDLGTAFNVQLSSSMTSVELAHGMASVSSSAGKTKDIVLSPGEMVVVDRRTSRMDKSLIAIDEIGAWRNGHIFVNDVTISSVIEQLQRYHSSWISIPDERLASQKVTGLYNIHDPDRALRALVEPYGGTVRNVSPYIRVITRF